LTLVSIDQRLCQICGTALTETSPGHDALDRLDEVLNGRYHLRSLLGIGGNGAVYQAEVVGLGTSVAVKVLHPALLMDKTARARLANEARLASQIDHPNIVSIVDYHATDALTYLVMEFLTGISLAEVLQEVGYIGVRRTIHIMRQVLSALEASHRQDVLHRDLKPENIYLTARQDDLDFVKVLDFGMATASQSESDARITAAGRICGTPAYMAPEQVRNRQLSPQSDLYAVGLLLYECLTGKNPFLTEGASATMVNHVTLTPVPPSECCPEAEIPPYLDALVMRGLRKEPTERFASADEFRKVLEGLVLAQRSRRSATALTTCPECGQPHVAEAHYCNACGHPLQGSRPLDRKAMAPDIIDALDASASQEFELSPTTTTVTGYRPGGWLPPLVGREHELEQIEEFFSFGPPPYAQRYLRLVGPAGSGKARLVREVVMRMAPPRSRALWVQPEILPVFASLHPIQRVARQLLELGPAHRDPQEILNTAEAKGFDMEMREGLLELFGVPSSPQSPVPLRRAQRAGAWRELIRMTNRERPLVLVFQDMHLYDGPSRELVAALVFSDPCDHPLCIIATHTPELMLLWGETQTLTLSSLGAREAQELGESLFSQLELKGDVGQMVAASGGNPLMLIELARLMSVEGKLQRVRGLPEVIDRRISQLPPRSRVLLHATAVLGRPTSSSTLVAMASTAEEDERALHFLSNLGLLVQREDGWRFAHRLHREVAYASTPVTMRQQLHARAAAAAIDEEAPPAYIAHHLFEAQEHEHAVPYLLRAGRRALHALDDELATQLFDRALRLIPRPPAQFGGERKPWISATLGLALSKHDSGDALGAIRSLRRATEMAHQAGWTTEVERLERQTTLLRQKG